MRRKGQWGGDESGKRLKEGEVEDENGRWSHLHVYEHTHVPR